MAAKNLEKALYGPSLTEVALGAFLGLVVGIVAACVYLVFKPVQTVLDMPPAAKIERNMVYYVAGHESSAKSRGWQAKEKQFIAGTTIQVVEDELNAWASTIGAPGSAAAPTPASAAKAAPKAGAKSSTPPPAAPAKPSDAAKPSADGFFIPGRPNFHIADGRIQIGLTCTLNWFGLTDDVVVKTTGQFRRDGDEVVYFPETFYLGSCPLHLIPPIVGPLMAHLVSREKIPDEIHAAWAKLKVVSFDGPALKLAAQ